MATRWGIASASRISHDFVTALGILPKTEHEVVAIAATDFSRASEFAELHKIPIAYGSYEDLARDPDVEIVYVGMLTPQHYDVSKFMLQNGKHVLCEKPLTMNSKLTSNLINLANEKGLFLMEGIWSRCFPLYQRIKDEIQLGIIGDVKQVIVTLGLKKPDPGGLKMKAQGRGTILDVGVYTIQLAQFIFNGDKPISIKASGFLNDGGVDQSVSAILLYSHNRTATMITNFDVRLPNEGIIVGTKGIIKIPEFWHPTRIELPAGVIEDPLPEGSHEFNFYNSAGLRFEAMEVRACLQAGKKESAKISHAESLTIAEIQDELRRQLGVYYPQDTISKQYTN